MSDRRPLLLLLAIGLLIGAAVLFLRPRDEAPGPEPAPAPSPVAATPAPPPPPAPMERTPHEPHPAAAPDAPPVHVATTPPGAADPAPAAEPAPADPSPRRVIRAPGPKTVLISNVAGEPPDLIADDTPDEAPAPVAPQGWSIWSSDNGVAGTLQADDTLTSAAGSTGRPSFVVGCAGRRPYMLFDPGVGLDTTVSGNQEYLQVVLTSDRGDLEDVKLTVKRNSGAASFPAPKQWLTRIEGYGWFEVSYQAADQTPVVARFTNTGAEALATELAACR